MKSKGGGGRAEEPRYDTLYRSRAGPASAARQGTSSRQGTGSSSRSAASTPHSSGRHELYVIAVNGTRSSTTS
jgi:hypothetical protein